jgi:hypothetical protein
MDFSASPETTKAVTDQATAGTRGRLDRDLVTELIAGGLVFRALNPSDK